MTMVTLIPIYTCEESGVRFAEVASALADACLELLGEGSPPSGQTLLVDDPLQTLALLHLEDDFFEIEHVAELCGRRSYPGLESSRRASAAFPRPGHE